MSAIKPRLVLFFTLLVWSASATISSAVYDPFCVAFCKPFLEDGVGLYQRCMKVCPETNSLLKRQEAEERFDSYADSVCDNRCSSYTEPESHKKCIQQCLRSLIGKKMKNEAICESSCTVIQETPFVMRCTRVCHERVPSANQLSS